MVLTQGSGSLHERRLPAGFRGGELRGISPYSGNNTSFPGNA